MKVFVDQDGAGGNLLGVFLDADRWSAERRQAIAAELSFSETVFVSDANAGTLRIHTPTVEIPLAGHPLVGTSWLLAEQDLTVNTLHPPAGDVPTWRAEGRTWIKAQPAWAPDFDLHQLPTPSEVDSHPGAGSDECLQVWSWLDPHKGEVRARVFPTALGITEDEATGAAALRLGALLQRPLTIRQGMASEILVRPDVDESVAIGGRVILVESSRYP